MNVKSHIPLFLFAVLASCSTTRVLKDGDYLYTGNKIVIEADKNVPVRSIGQVLKKNTIQKTNKKFLGQFPMKLWFYNLPGDSVPADGFKHWIKYKMGEPPVLYKDYQTEATKASIGKTLQNRGYFQYQITTKKRIKKKKLAMEYHINLEEPFTVSRISYPESADTLTSRIKSYEGGSLIREQSPYSLEQLKNERTRIAEKLKTEGFFYFRPDHLYFRADTHTMEHQVLVELDVRRDIPREAQEFFTVNRVFVHHGVSVLDPDEKGDTLELDSLFHIHPDRMNLEADLLKRHIRLKTGERYDERNYEKTLHILNSLDVYQFISIRLSGADDTLRSLLDVHVFLTDKPKRRVQAEFQLVSKSNGFTGPGLQFSYLDRNLNKNAIQFKLEQNSGFEAQLSRSIQDFYSLELGTGVELIIPQILAPEFVKNRFRNNLYIPKTRIRTAYNYFRRSQQFTIHSGQISFGYHWKRSTTHSHELRLLSVEYLKRDQASLSIEESSLLEQYYTEQFISLVNYGFTLNNLALRKEFNHLFHVSAETAGNLLALIKAPGGNSPEGDLPSHILGVPFAQFFRLFCDYRVYYNLSHTQKLVGRTFLGAGIPYGNSHQMPYIKQFYSGGPSSIRAFPSRAVGPGSYYPGEHLDTESFMDQTGDIKLEWNLEYRFNIYKVLKGALFTDAGNIWHFNEHDKPGATFSAEFLSQLAVGAGAGFRVDLSILVLRMDIAFPLRKPYLPEGERWVLDRVDFTSQAWRKVNMVYNLAIGYPF